LIIKDTHECNLKNLKEKVSEEINQVHFGHIQDQHYYRQVGSYIISE